MTYGQWKPDEAFRQHIREAFSNARHRQQAEAAHEAEVEALCHELDRDPEVQRRLALYRANPEALFEDMRRWNSEMAGTGIQWFGPEIDDEDFEEEDEDENNTPETQNPRHS